MKLIHLSDLHIGIRVNEYPFSEDQKYMLNKILDIIDSERPDAVLIAGDIYDKSVPSAEAVELFDDFIVSLSDRKTQVFIISGNHDSPEHLAFGNRLIDACGIHISPVYNGEITPYYLHDAYGDVGVFMLPFVKPLNVRRFFPDEQIESYTDALRAAIGHIQLDSSCRNIILTHQFVTGATRSDSEEVSVGGTDNVDVSVFDDFDYVALGHIHGPQNIGSERVRYCGTPLRYSFSEVNQVKSVTVAELSRKGSLSVRTIPLVPLHNMTEIKGKYNDLTLKSFYNDTSYPYDYIHITLTDEEDIPDAIGKLRPIYHNLMKLDYDNSRTRHNSEIEGTTDVESKSPFELFAELYELQNNAPMSPAQSDYMEKMIGEIREDKQ